MPSRPEPGAAGDEEALVGRLHGQILRFAEERGLERPIVEAELRDGSRFSLDSISAGPGYGFVTLHVHPEEDVPAQVVVPVEGIARIEVYAEKDEEATLGFSLREPPAG
jgi:hypothetical protein